MDEAMRGKPSAQYLTICTYLVNVNYSSLKKKSVLVFCVLLINSFSKLSLSSVLLGLKFTFALLIQKWFTKPAKSINRYCQGNLETLRGKKKLFLGYLSVLYACICISAGDVVPVVYSTITIKANALRMFIKPLISSHALPLGGCAPPEGSWHRSPP